MMRRLLSLNPDTPNIWKKCVLSAMNYVPRSTLTDAEVEQVIKARFAQSRKMLDIREKYYNEFRKFLSPKQIQKMYNMEKRIGDKMRKEMGKRQGMKKNNNSNSRR